MMRTEQHADTWLGVLGEAALRRPAAVAFTYLVDGEQEVLELSYAELDRGARRVAAYLQEHGLAGERVVLWYPSGLDYLIAFFGCLYAGAVAVPAYPPTVQRRSVERVLAIVEDAVPACALTTARIRDRLPASIVVGGRPPIATDTLEQPLAEAWREPEVGPDTVAFLQYTSGSTARPRGVVLTHRNLLANSAMIHELFGTSERTRAVSWLPMYHDMGLIGSILQVLYCGGSATLMSPAAFVQNPVRWLRAISRTGATASGGPNFAYDLCVDRITPAERAELDLSTWDLAFNGAEPIRAETLERFSRTFADCGFRREALTPCYGLAEATLLVSARRVGTGGCTDAKNLVSCGMRPDGARVEIVDPQARTVCEQGSTGEIWVSGPGVGQGYWNQPAATAETFQATLAGSAGPRFLRTGDLGYLHEGELYVTGRQKDLIIVRGRNHYPQDIERTAELLEPMLRRGGGAAFSVPIDGAEQLVVVAEVQRDHLDTDLPALAGRVRAAVAAEHDARPHTVALIRAGDLPKTSSGKVQRRACREAYLTGALDLLAVAAGAMGALQAGTTVPAVAPTWSVAGILAVGDLLRAEIAEVARIHPDQVDLDQPLVTLGLDSMTVIALQHRIETRLGIEVPLEDALSGTGTELIELVARRKATVLRTPAAPVAATPTCPADLALPANQTPLWLQHQLVPDSSAHVLAMAVRISGPVDADALRRAVQVLADRHEALRTTFPLVGGAPVARVHALRTPGFTVIDATGWDQATLDSRTAQAAHEPFDIVAGPLLRVTLFVLGPAEHRLVIAVDHLVADLWSLEVLLRELDVRYPAQLQYPAAPQEVTPPSPGAYSAFAREQEASLAGAADRLWTYWSDRLAGAPTLLSLDTRPVRRGARRMRCDAVPFTVDAEVDSALTALAGQLGVTRYAVLLAAYQALLGQWSGQRDLLVGSPAHGRTRAAHRNTVGLLINMLVLRGKPTPDRTVAQLIEEAHRGARSALAHADLPFSHLVERLQPERDPSRSALVQAVLTWQHPIGEHRELISALALNRAGTVATIGGLAMETLELPSSGAQFDLVLTLADIDGRLTGRLQYDTDLFDATTVQRAVDHLVRLLASFAADPEARLDALPALGAPSPATTATTTPATTAEDQIWDGGTPARPLRCVHDLFADQVAARPDATAVVFEGDSLTYAELDSRAERLAQQLRRAGVAAGDLVALLLQRSIEMVVAIVAVMKAGGAYLPLDPAHPVQRRRSVLDSAAPRYAIVRRTRLDRHGVTVIDLDQPDLDQPAAGGPGETGPLPGSELDRLAYVIYTSGSSGLPKGVPIDHRALANLFAATTDYAFDHTDVWTLFHSYAFDFSVWELWGPLIHGGVLIIVPPEATLSAEAFWTLLHRHRVTVLNQTPAVFREMTATSPDRLAGLALRHVIFGGEKVEPGHLAAWRAHGAPATRLTNMYGITEITVHATYGPIGTGGADGVVPIGGPLRGTELCLLDAGGNPVPDGEAGEICLSGRGLAWGYLGQAALTATRFTPHPLLPARRMYRSGDLARRRPDGTLEYLGRADDQVQIRGYRIEPGEVVAALVTSAGVRDAVVVADTGPTGAQRLVAYVVPAAGAAPSGAELRDHLRGHLPEYMVPGRFITIETIPLTVNGKVDYRALPSAAGTAGQAEPATDTERTVARLVGEMVALPRVGRHDDLFDLGWHSLLVARLVSRIQEEFAVSVPLPALFAEPTVERISAMIDTGLRSVDRPAAGPAISRVDRSRYQVTTGAAALPEAMRP